MVWTHFWDMHSGGGQKLKWSHIFIEAPEKQAEIIFQNSFGRNPNRVTCTCCGEDYASSEGEDLKQLCGFHLGWKYQYFDKNGNRTTEDKAWVSGKGLINGATSKYIEEPSADHYGKHFKTWKDFIKDKTFFEFGGICNVLIIKKNQIKPSERKGKLRKEGYVWMD